MSVTSGENNSYVTKDDFQQLQSRVESLIKAASSTSVYKNDDVLDKPPAPPPPRKPGQTGKSATMPMPKRTVMISAADPPGLKNHHSSCKSACTKPGCTHNDEHKYEDITISRDADEHQYEKLKFDEETGGDIPSRLKTVETNQERISKAQTEILKEIKGLKTAVEKLQQTVEKVQFQLLENSDHLGQQILHVRRDILAATKNQPSTFKPGD